MRNKVLTLALMLFVVMSLIGCGKSKEANKDLTLWVNCNEREISNYREIIKKWSDDNGIGVKVVKTNIDRDIYIGTANTSGKADLVWGASSEDLEKFIQTNTIEELRTGVDNEGNYISQDLIQNTSMKGKRYAVPVYQESVALFYNKNLVTNVPSDMNDLLQESEKKGFSFYINNAFFSYGFISTYGGYVFKNQDGNFIGDDIGLWNNGAIKGYTMLQDICTKYHLIKGDTDDNVAEMAFARGDSAYYLGESKKIQNFKKIGMNFSVAKVPKIDGQDFKSFKTVKMAFVNPKSKNKDKSYELLQYLIQNAGDIMINKGDRVPVLKSDLEKESFKNNQYLQGFYQQVQVAEVTPNISKLKIYWQVMDRNLELLTSGSQTPKECAKSVEKDFKEQLANS